MSVSPNYVQPCYPDDNAYDPADDYQPASFAWMERLRKDKRHTPASSQHSPALRLIRGENCEGASHLPVPHLVAVPWQDNISPLTIFHFGIRCIEKSISRNDGSIEAKDILLAINKLQKLESCK